MITLKVGQTLNSLNLVPLGGKLYGADITRFAGMTAELRFTVFPGSALLLDSISFSTRPVP
jgi:hypothetical protein